MNLYATVQITEVTSQFQRLTGYVGSHLAGGRTVRTASECVAVPDTQDRVSFTEHY